MTPHRITGLCIALLLSLALTAACGATSSARLAGTAWTLIELNGQAPVQGRQATMRFEKDTIQGSTGCNTYGGGYAARAETLTIKEVYATEMACLEPQGLMDQEREFLAALAVIAAHRIDGDQLELLDASGTVLLAFAAADE